MSGQHPWMLPCTLSYLQANGRLSCHLRPTQPMWRPLQAEQPAHGRLFRVLAVNWSSKDAAQTWPPRYRTRSVRLIGAIPDGPESRGVCEGPWQGSFTSARSIRPACRPARIWVPFPKVHISGFFGVLDAKKTQGEPNASRNLVIPASGVSCPKEIVSKWQVVLPFAC